MGYERSLPLSAQIFHLSSSPQTAGSSSPRYTAPGAQAGLGGGAPLVIVGGPRVLHLRASAEDQVACVGRVPGPRCFAVPLQRAVSACVRRDERRRQGDPAECDGPGPPRALRTTPCYLSRRRSHAALRQQPCAGGERHRGRQIARAK